MTFTFRTTPPSEKQEMEQFQTPKSSNSPNHTSLNPHTKFTDPSKNTSTVKKTKKEKSTSLKKKKTLQKFNGEHPKDNKSKIETKKNTRKE